MATDAGAIATMFERQELLRRVRWQLILRWIATALVFVAVLVVSALFPGVLPTLRLLVILGVLVAGNLVTMLVLIPGLERSAWPWSPALLIKGQIVVDLLVYSVFLHWSGGAENPASVFYVLQVIMAGVLLSGRWAFLSAGASSLLYALVLALEYSGVLPHVHLTGVTDPGLYDRPILLLLLWGMLTSALVVAAYMASTIVQQMRQRERDLLRSNLACELRSTELADANRRLNEMAASRDTFLRYVTHELRAPVAAIQSYLRLLREGYIEPERIPEVALRAEKRAEEVLTLIGDLLDLGQVEHARAQEGRERLDPGETLMESVDMLRPSAVAKHITLEVSLGRRLPTVFASRRHLGLLWNNLISNAIKYTPPGGRVKIRLENDDRDLRMTISDTGIGISPGDRERIFQEFFRADAARKFDLHGTGIGLAIVQKVVEMYDGTVAVDSTEGKGTTFRVSLPMTALRAGSPLPGDDQPRRPTKLPRTLV